MPFETVAEKNHDARPPFLYLGNPGREPALPESRTETLIGQSDERYSVQGRVGDVRCEGEGIVNN